MFRFSDYFSYEDAYIEGTSLIFKKCTLKKAIGDFRSGHVFEFVDFIYLYMELRFYDKNDNNVMIKYFELSDSPMDN